jgi:hypothetical protein
MQLLITDETFTGRVLNEITLEFDITTVLLKDIIAARVEKEVALYNERVTEYFNGLVEPTDAEKTLNGYKLKNKNRIDAEKQVYVALDAFMKNGYFVLVDKIQADSLEQPVQISKNTTVSFVKLTPLVGG